MLPSIDHALNEQTATVALTLCASLELSSINVARHLPVAREG